MIAHLSAVLQVTEVGKRNLSNLSIHLLPRAANKAVGIKKNNALIFARALRLWSLSDTLNSSGAISVLHLVTTTRPCQHRR